MVRVPRRLEASRPFALSLPRRPNGLSAGPPPFPESSSGRRQKRVRAGACALLASSRRHPHAPPFPPLALCEPVIPRPLRAQVEELLRTHRSEEPALARAARALLPWAGERSGAVTLPPPPFPPQPPPERCNVPGSACPPASRALCGATWAGRGQWELRAALLQQRRWGRGGGGRGRGAAQGQREGGREGERGRGTGVFKPDSHSGRSRG